MWAKDFLSPNTSKDTREHWCGVDSLASSVVNESTLRTGVGMQTVVEVGDIKYLGDNYDPGLPDNSWTLPGPGKAKQTKLSN